MPGRELTGIHFAMDFLTRNSKRVQGSYVPDDDFISAQGKHVLVIGGGDTGSDCIGTSNRHGAKSVTQIEILDKPPVKEDKGLTWPDWPNKLRTSSSQEEGCERHWNVATKGFIGDDQGRVQAVKYCLVRWDKDAQGRWQMSEVPGSEAEFKADLVLLAMGFVHPVHAGHARGAQGRDRAGTRPPRQRQGRHRGRGRLPDLGARGLRGGGHAPRAVAGRLGHPRGAAVRAGGG